MIPIAILPVTYLGIATVLVARDGVSGAKGLVVCRVVGPLESGFRPVLVRLGPGCGDRSRIPAARFLLLGVGLLIAWRKHRRESFSEIRRQPADPALLGKPGLH